MDAAAVEGERSCLSREICLRCHRCPGTCVCGVGVDGRSCNATVTKEKSAEAIGPAGKKDGPGRAERQNPMPRRISAGGSRIGLLICPLYAYIGSGELAAPSLATP